MVHELNNIVFVLQGNLEMILEDLPPDHPCCHFTQEALVAVGRARSLLQEARPRDDTQAPATRRGPGAASGDPDLKGRSLRVLLVDDDPMLLDALGRGLTNLGFQVQACADPGQALELVKTDQEGFDALVSDLIMPQMTGEELAKQVLNTTSNLPIILMSGFQDESVGALTAQPGIALVLTKPIQFKDLAKAILDCVGVRNGK